MSIGRGLTVALTAWTMTGCYRYVATPAEATPAGTDVRLLVTSEGSGEVREVGALGPNDEPRFDGTVVGREGADLLVRVPVALRRNGFVESRIEQSVRVPMSEIVSLQRRELNKVSTGLLLAGGAAVLGALVVVIADPLGGEQPDPEPPPDELFSLEIFSLPVGR